MSKAAGDKNDAGEMLKKVYTAKKNLKELHETLVDGDDVSCTAAELANHIGEEHEVVDEAVDKLAESAGRLIDETLGTDGLGASAKVVVEVVEDVLGSAQDVCSVVAEHGAEPVHAVARAALEVTGGAPGGMPEVERSSVDLSELQEAAEETVQGLGGGEGVASEVLETIVEEVTVEAASEFAEAALDVVPVVGQCLSIWKLLRGTASATVGAGALVVAGSIAVVGSVVSLNERTRTAAISTAWWGASLAGEGALTVAKGATNIVGGVPGTQFATIPLSMSLGLAARRCAKVRSS